jgi:catabolite regulation protein CreA
LKVQKNPASIAASGKNVNVAIRTAIAWRYMENVTFFSENKNSTYNEKFRRFFSLSFKEFQFFRIFDLRFSSK